MHRTEGGWDQLPAIGFTTNKPTTSSASPTAAELPGSLKKPYAVLTALDRRLADQPNASYERAFVREALAAIEARRLRASVDPGPGHFRPMTPEKRLEILKLYEDTALRMYSGLTQHMANSAKSPQAEKRCLAKAFQESVSGGDRGEVNRSSASRLLRWQRRRMSVESRDRATYVAAVRVSAQQQYTGASDWQRS